VLSAGKPADNEASLLFDQLINPRSPAVEEAGNAGLLVQRRQRPGKSDRPSCARPKLNDPGFLQALPNIAMKINFGCTSTWGIFIFSFDILRIDQFERRGRYVRSFQCKSPAMSGPRL
jgi:hypothetical protein